MSLDIPASLEREIELYAEAENITPREAAVRLLSEILRDKNSRTTKARVTEADLATLRKNVPIFAFLEQLPDQVIDEMEAASRQTKSERFVPRG